MYNCIICLIFFVISSIGKYLFNTYCHFLGGGNTLLVKSINAQIKESLKLKSFASLITLFILIKDELDGLSRSFLTVCEKSL